jgi:hypothetical protein
MSSKCGVYVLMYSDIFSEQKYFADALLKSKDILIVYYQQMHLMLILFNLKCLKQ